MKHIVKETVRGVVTTKCGITFRGEEAASDTTVWWSEATCPACTPFIWVDDPKGHGKMMVSRDEVKSTPPKPRVLRRRPKPSA